MASDNQTALKRIDSKLWRGIEYRNKYGHWLHLAEGSKGRWLWVYENYGMSATSASVKNLSKVIREVFKTTPVEFENEYGTGKGADDGE